MPAPDLISGEVIGFSYRSIETSYGSLARSPFNQITKAGVLLSLLVLLLSNVHAYDSNTNRTSSIEKMDVCLPEEPLPGVLPLEDRSTRPP